MTERGLEKRHKHDIIWHKTWHTQDWLNPVCVSYRCVYDIHMCLTLMRVWNWCVCDIDVCVYHIDVCVTLMCVWHWEGLQSSHQVNASFQTYEWVASHTWMSQVTNPCVSHTDFTHSVTYVNESCHTHEWVASRTQLFESCIEKGFHAATYVNESCHTRENIMSQTWLIQSYIADGLYVDESCHTHMNESCHAHMNESWITQVWFSLTLSAASIQPHVWMSHATHMNESCHTHDCLESYIKDGFNPAGILMDKCVHAITPLCWYQVRDTVFSWYLVSSWHIQLIHITHITNCLTHFQPPYC